MTLLMCLNVLQAGAAQSPKGNPQLMKDIDVLNTISSEYNSKPIKDKSRVDQLLSSYESMMGRKLNVAERAFLSLQFATMNVLPSFEVKGNSIQIYDHGEGTKDLVISVEVIDAEKNIFKFGEKTFTLDPNKAIHENIQHILKELEKGDKVSIWQRLNPFGIPQAHAEMANWMKIAIAGAVALLVGIVIYKVINKNKNKDAQIAEGNPIKRMKAIKEEKIDENNSHTVEAESEAAPALSEEPAVV